MSQSKWTPELGQILKELRQEAGLDIAILARRHTVSTSQIRQLEGGGDSAFYSPDIKFSVGKKLLLALGHPFKEEEPTVETLATPLEGQAEITESTLVTLALDPLVAPKPTSFRLWMGLFVVALMALVIAGLYLKSTQAPAASPTPVTSEATPVAKPISTSNESLTSPPLENALAVKTAPPNSACNWTESDVAIQPTFPSKSAEYVHVVAPQDATVCIMDAQQRVATLTLSAGDARSIYGPEPFRVYSADLSLLKLYFQGQLMKLPAEDVRHIQLIAAAVP